MNGWESERQGKLGAIDGLLYHHRRQLEHAGPAGPVESVYDNGAQMADSRWQMADGKWRIATRRQSGEIVAPGGGESMKQVIVCPGEDGYGMVECPRPLGCISPGQTREPAIAHIREAIREYEAALEGDQIANSRAASRRLQKGRRF